MPLQEIAQAQVPIRTVDVVIRVRNADGNGGQSQGSDEWRNRLGSSRGTYQQDCFTQSTGQRAAQPGSDRSIKIQSGRAA